eukprot:1572897-Rhodomonas_salina.1
MIKGGLRLLPLESNLNKRNRNSRYLISGCTASPTFKFMLARAAASASHVRWRDSQDSRLLSSFERIRGWSNQRRYDSNRSTVAYQSLRLLEGATRIFKLKHGISWLLAHGHVASRGSWHMVTWHLVALGMMVTERTP